MRTRMIAAAVMTLGLVGVPAFVQADHAPQQRTEARTSEHETRTMTRDARPEQRDSHVQVRDQHVQRDFRTDRDERRDVRTDRDEHRDVHVEEHVYVDRGHDGWRHDRVDYIPAPVIVSTPVYVAPNVCTPVGINQVPPAVLNAAARQTGGAPIVAVDFVQNGGGTFYDVHVAGAYNTVQTLRFGINGGFYGNV